MAQQSGGSGGRLEGEVLTACRPAIDPSCHPCMRVEQGVPGGTTIWVTLVPLWASVFSSVKWEYYSSLLHRFEVRIKWVTTQRLKQCLEHSKCVKNESYHSHSGEAELDGSIKLHPDLMSD